jgi:type I thyroxine 5'-deiodinase
VIFETPRDYGERAAVAGACSRDLRVELPALVDAMDDSTERAYTAWPDRIYVVDREGKVAYKSEAGPFGFKTDLLADALGRVAAPGER